MFSLYNRPSRVPDTQITNSLNWKDMGTDKEREMQGL
jgi:hypothetical protein